MELKEIKDITVDLMDALKSRGLGEVSIEAKDFKIKIKANAPSPVVYSSSPAAQPEVKLNAVSNANDDKQEEPEQIQGTKVKAPLVGTFYAAPSPEEPPYIEVGQTVKKGDTLFIIEAMKTMNEISAPCDGTVSRIMALSGDMVEFDQTLAVIV